MLILGYVTSLHKGMIDNLSMSLVNPKQVELGTSLVLLVNELSFSLASIFLLSSVKYTA